MWNVGQVQARSCAPPSLPFKPSATPQPRHFQQGMEAGLGLPTSAPTAQELRAGEQMHMGAAGSASGEVGPATGEAHVAELLQQQAAAATPEGQVAIRAALFGSFGGDGQAGGAEALVRAGPAGLAACAWLPRRVWVAWLGGRLPTAILRCMESQTAIRPFPPLLQGAAEGQQAQQQQAQQQPPQMPADKAGAAAAVAFDNEAANLAGGGKAEE